MTSKIFKYVIDRDLPEPFIIYPEFSKIIDIQIQNGQVCLWAKVDPDKGFKEVKQKFSILGTGWDADDVQVEQHLKTIQEGPFVWHIFDAGEEYL
jgi:hypothetical protein